MNKGIVVKQTRGAAIVLTSEGSFQKVKIAQQAEIGEEISFSNEQEAGKIRMMAWSPAISSVMRVSVLVLVFMLALFPVYSWYQGNKAYAYISLDFNPSIEMKVNNNMNVISIASLNNDAKTVIASLDDWENKSVEDVTSQLMRISLERGLLKESGNIIIGVNYISDLDEDQRLSESLEATVIKVNHTLRVASFHVPNEIREQAQQENKSMNEMMAQSILEGKYTSNNNASLTQADSAIIEQFYNNETQESAEETNQKDNNSNQDEDAVEQQKDADQKEETSNIIPQNESVPSAEQESTNSDIASQTDPETEKEAQDEENAEAESDKEDKEEAEQDTNTDENTEKQKKAQEKALQKDDSNRENNYGNDRNEGEPANSKGREMSEQHRAERAKEVSNNLDKPDKGNEKHHKADDRDK